MRSYIIIVATIYLLTVNFIIDATKPDYIYERLILIASYSLLTIFITKLKRKV